VRKKPKPLSSYADLKEKRKEGRQGRQAGRQAGRPLLITSVKVQGSIM